MEKQTPESQSTADVPKGLVGLFHLALRLPPEVTGASAIVFGTLLLVTILKGDVIGADSKATRLMLTIVFAVFLASSLAHAVIGFRRRKRSRGSMSDELESLTPPEELCLKWCIANDRRSISVAASNVIVRSLMGRGILQPRDAEPADVKTFVIPRFVWEMLMVSDLRSSVSGEMMSRLHSIPSEAALIRHLEQAFADDGGHQVLPPA